VSAWDALTRGAPVSWRAVVLSHHRHRIGTEDELAAVYRRHRTPNAAAAAMTPVAIRVYGQETPVVWDGVHRWRMARRRGVSRIPAIVSRYDSDGRFVEAADVVLRMKPGTG